MTEPLANGTIRLDRWLWFARFFKSRSLATKLVQGRRVRVNRIVVAKPSIAVKPGDVLTFPQGDDIRVIKVVAAGIRRGPAPEAQTLYEDLDPPKPPDAAAPAQRAAGHRAPGAGRPTKSDRRAIQRLRGGE